MARGGYTHGKRSERPIATVRPPPERYLEDRVATLETMVAGLVKLASGALEREEAIIHHDLAELDLKKREHAARKKKSALQRALKKPLKRKLKKVPR